MLHILLFKILLISRLIQIILQPVFHFLNNFIRQSLYNPAVITFPAALIVKVPAFVNITISYPLRKGVCQPCGIPHVIQRIFPFGFCAAYGYPIFRFRFVNLTAALNSLCNGQLSISAARLPPVPFFTHQAG